MNISTKRALFGKPNRALLVKAGQKKEALAVLQLFLTEF